MTRAVVRETELRSTLLLWRVLLAVHVSLLTGVVGWLVVDAGAVSRVVQPVARANGNGDRNPRPSCITADTGAIATTVAAATGASNTARGTESLGPIRDISEGLPGSLYISHGLTPRVVSGTSLAALNGLSNSGPGPSPIQYGFTSRVVGCPLCEWVPARSIVIEW